MSNLRNRRALAAVNLAGFGIEYGALGNPLVTRSMSPGIRYVDYASREALVEKYAKDPRVRTEDIVLVDIVTDGRPIDGLVEPGSLDYVVASHVFEHLPDPIRWLRTNLEVLRPGGRIALVVPDRRYCFDLARPATRLSDMACAYVEQRTRPSFAQVVEHVFEAREVKALDVWEGRVTAETAPLRRPASEALRSVQGYHQRADYIDVHCWKLADHECLALMEEARRLFALPMDVVAYWPTQFGKNEFFICLERTAEPI